MTKHCEFIKPDGSQCGAFAMIGRDSCFIHSPTTARERAAARSRGGVAKADSNRTKAESKRKETVISQELLDRIIELEEQGARVENALAQGSNFQRVGNVEPEEEVNLGEQPTERPKATGRQG